MDAFAYATQLSWALEGLIILSKEIFQTHGQRGAVWAFKPFIIKHKLWYFSEKAKAKHPNIWKAVQAAVNMPMSNQKLIDKRPTGVATVTHKARFIYVIEASERRTFKGKQNVWPAHRILPNVREFDRRRTRLGVGDI